MAYSPLPAKRQPPILYSPGTTMAEVPPDFRGQEYEAWRRDQITLQSSAYLAKCGDPKDAPINQKAVATKRDSYGWRSA